MVQHFEGTVIPNLQSANCHLDPGRCVHRHPDYAPDLLTMHTTAVVLGGQWTAHTCAYPVINNFILTFSFYVQCGRPCHPMPSFNFACQRKSHVGERNSCSKLLKISSHDISVRLNESFRLSLSALVTLVVTRGRCDYIPSYNSFLWNLSPLPPYYIL